MNTKYDNYSVLSSNHFDIIIVLPDGDARAFLRLPDDEEGGTICDSSINEALDDILIES